MSTLQREMTFLLSDPERRLLRSVAKRLPACVTSNYLTTVGPIGAVGAGGAYTLSGVDPGWLWAASLMLLVNWLGDSLDGTLARVRARERPRYGYYLDHLVDAFSTAIVGIGIGLSPYVQLELALVLVLSYLALSINVYLESAVFGVFRLAYGCLGPTEARIILIGCNTAIAVAAYAGVGSPAGVGRARRTVRRQSPAAHSHRTSGSAVSRVRARC